MIGRKTETDGVYNIVYEEQGTDKDTDHIYAPFECDSSSHLPAVSVHEPVYANPCSYEATATVLRNIAKRSGLRQHGGVRDWIIVVCDGVPYNLCRRLVASTHICHTCNMSFNGMDSLVDHSNKHHDGVATGSREFDWVVLQPGAGNIEINMVKGVVELGWDINWKELAIILNFKSETALQCAKKVSDHHKGWTMCRIARLAITRELMVSYVREQLVNSGPISVSGFLKFTMHAKDPNYSFMADFVLEILDAVFMFRCGQRCCNADVMIAARGKFAKHWSGRVHPLYRELEMADLLTYIRMPTDVQDVIKASMSLNLTGRKHTGEGVDFRLEEVNKQIKHWLPSVPSPNDWHTTCTNYDRLIQFREKTFAQQGASDPRSYGSRSPQNIQQEVMAFRVKLRDAEYSHHPHEERPHKSLDGSRFGS